MLDLENLLQNDNQEDGSDDHTSACGLDLISLPLLSGHRLVLSRHPEEHETEVGKSRKQECGAEGAHDGIHS